MHDLHPVLVNIRSLAQRSAWHQSIEQAHIAFDAWATQRPQVNFTRIYFVGCGTSFYAGQVGKYAVEHLAGIPAEALQAFAFTAYAEPTLLGPQTLVVGISTTGETAAVADALIFARRHGAATLALTAHASSAVTRAAESTVLTGGEDDTLPAKTKSYVLSIATVYMLASQLAGSAQASDWLVRIEHAIAAVQEFLDTQEPAIAQLAERYREAPAVHFVGSGPNAGTIQEGALKVIEMAKLLSDAQELEDFLHGRLNATDTSTPIIFIAPQGHATQRTLDFLTVNQRVGVPSVVLTDTVTPAIEQLATDIIRMPSGLDEWVTPLLYIVPLHLFCYYLATQRGFDPAARRYNIIAQRVRFGDE